MSYKVTKGADERGAFQTFEDLEVYKMARGFRKEMYAVARELTEFEKFALADQIRRAAVSLTNNMAEGHGRFHYPDQIRFFLHSRGSLQELVDDLNVCADENYLGPAEVERLKDTARDVLALINGYMRYLRSRATSVREGEEEETESEPLQPLPL
ncbi:MAG: four helix bundle protein [Chthoniobacterales bacterium]|nr:four helix bundle protein [Chthoniobacterales bacterium]